MFKIFITRIAGKYNIPQEDLLTEWDTISPLYKLSKPDLISIAKKHSLPITGNKTDLLNRILQVPTVTVPEPTKEKPTPTPVSTLKHRCKILGIPTNGSKQDLIRRLDRFEKTSSSPFIRTIPIRPFRDGFIHEETQLVLNAKKQVYGRRVDNVITPFTPLRDIPDCKSFNFKWTM